MTNMNLTMINPFVRFARIKEITIPQGLSQAVDHRIFYCHSGDGQLEANGVLYSFTAGTLIYLPAGTPYRYIFDQEIPVFSGCNFDFYQDHNTMKAPIPPVPQDNFSNYNILEKNIFEENDIFSHCIYLDHAFQFEDKFAQIAEEFINHNLYYEMRCSALLKDVLVILARLIASQTQGINRQIVDDVLQYIHCHYNHTLTNGEIAAHFNYHQNYINLQLLKYTGLTLHQYVLNHKMHMAVVFLQSTNLSISEVAEKVGMPDIKHFSKCFKKIIGHSPSQFKIK